MRRCCGWIRPDRLRRLSCLLSLTGLRRRGPRRLRTLSRSCRGRSRPSGLRGWRRRWIWPWRLRTLRWLRLPRRLRFGKPHADFRSSRGRRGGSNLGFGLGLRFGLWRFGRRGRGGRATGIAIVGSLLLGRRLIALVQFLWNARLRARNALGKQWLAIAFQLFFVVKHIVIKQRRRVELTALRTSPEREHQREQRAGPKQRTMTARSHSTNPYRLRR